MSELAPFPYRVRVVMQPYNYHKLRDMMRSLNHDFGPPGRDRWRFRVPKNEFGRPYETANDYPLEFEFRDTIDAVLFGIKYQ